jgi:ADP-dependent NAD(P)H-hydrate dehydratase / NAD(P)H-hydrate epimerase
MHAAEPLFTTEGVRAIDRAAIDRCGIAGYALMCRAGAAAFAAVRTHWPQARRLLVVCGSGNNGGDGFVLARLARAAGMHVDLLALSEQPYGDEAIEAWWAWREAGGGIVRFEPGTALPEADLVVDALFGIGLNRAPEGRAAALIEAVNAHRAPCLALDLASGVDADTGAVPGVAVCATRTISFIVAKRGLFTGPARDCSGLVEVAALEVPAKALAAARPVAARLTSPLLAQQIPPRRANAHKGEFGHVIAVGGDLGYGGALRLCVEGAARSGAGLVSAITRSAHRSGLLAALPECMVVGSDHGELPIDLLHRASVLALGPGLGVGEWGRDLFPRLLAFNKPTVLDADALNLLAESPRLLPGRILTPHPGEAARLLGQASAAAIQDDRFDALARLVDRYQAVVVLKGAGSLIGAPGETPFLIDAGNPGMATGGMGDVLTGVIAGLLAQGFEPFRAAAVGALLHAAAGDAAAAEGGMRGLLASDLFPHVRRLANPVPVTPA